MSPTEIVARSHPTASRSGLAPLGAGFILFGAGVALWSASRGDWGITALMGMGAAFGVLLLFSKPNRARRGLEVRLTESEIQYVSHLAPNRAVSRA